MTAAYCMKVRGLLAARNLDWQDCNDDKYHVLSGTTILAELEMGSEDPRADAYLPSSANRPDEKLP